MKRNRKEEGRSSFLFLKIPVTGLRII